MALDGAHRAAQEVLEQLERRHAAAAADLAAAGDALRERLAATEAEFRTALQVRAPDLRRAALRALRD